MKYFVTMDGREFLVELDGSRVRIDGFETEVHLSPIPGTPLRLLQLGDLTLTCSVAREAQGRWVVGYHGERFHAEVLDERARHIRGLTGPGSGRASGGVLKAPMPGLVLRVLVEAGQVVEAGQGVVVLEAMKMENELRAGGGGRVSVVHAQPGQAVEKGQVLVEFEPEVG